MSSAFVKKINTTPQLYKGKPDVRHSQTAGGMYLLSTGNQSLDSVIGGGMVVGSLTVMFEDCLSHYFSYFQKTYLAEGIVREQPSLVVDPEPLRTKDHWLKFLPAVAEIKGSTTDTEETKATDNTQLK